MPGRRRLRVWGVEGDREAVEHARRNVPEARFTAGGVDAELVVGRLPRRADLVVLDPPRTGAGEDVVDAGSPGGPGRSRTWPATRRRWPVTSATARELGYRPTSIRGFDLFPMTHHLEAVAILAPA